MNELDHDFLRHLADTWGLIALFVVFVIAVLTAFRPGSAAYYRKCAEIPLAEDRKQNHDQ